MNASFAILFQVARCFSLYCISIFLLSVPWKDHLPSDLDAIEHSENIGERAASLDSSNPEALISMSLQHAFGGRSLSLASFDPKSFHYNCRLILFFRSPYHRPELLLLTEEHVCTLSYACL